MFWSIAYVKISQQKKLSVFYTIVEGCRRTLIYYMDINLFENSTQLQTVQATMLVVQYLLVLACSQTYGREKNRLNTFYTVYIHETARFSWLNNKLLFLYKGTVLIRRIRWRKLLIIKLQIDHTLLSWRIIYFTNGQTIALKLTCPRMRLTGNCLIDRLWKQAWEVDYNWWKWWQYNWRMQVVLLGKGMCEKAHRDHYFIVVTNMEAL